MKNSKKYPDASSGLRLNTGTQTEREQRPPRMGQKQPSNRIKSQGHTHVQAFIYEAKIGAKESRSTSLRPLSRPLFMKMCH